MSIRQPLAAVLLAGAALGANAASYTVDAYANSSSGGTGVSTISLLAGESFSVNVDPTDLWNAGALPRWSNANGLTSDLFATGSDDSGEAVGTHIGTPFPLWTQDGFTAAYGSLVGKIGSSYLLLGTSFSGTAPTSGTLQLFYWDSNFGDNSEHITANVAAAVPEPETYALLLGGLGAMGLLARRRSTAAR